MLPRRGFYFSTHDLSVSGAVVFNVRLFCFNMSCILHVREGEESRGVKEGGGRNGWIEGGRECRFDCPVRKLDELGHVAVMVDRTDSVAEILHWTANGEGPNEEEECERRGFQMKRGPKEEGSKKKRRSKKRRDPREERSRRRRDRKEAERSGTR